MSARTGDLPAAGESLQPSDAAKFLIQECRMVLPGIQALFGFQLIAVFSSEFAKKLSAGQQELHLVAIGLIALAIGLIMTPAAYHRQTSPCRITPEFISLCTRLMLWAMVPLALGLCLDFYLVMYAVIRQPWTALIAAGVLVYLLCLWFVLPRLRPIAKTP